MNKNKLHITVMMVLLAICGSTNAKKLNFNAGWRLQVGDVKGALEPECDDRDWQAVTLPYAFNGSEAFKKDIERHYRPDRHHCLVSEEILHGGP